MRIYEGWAVGYHDVMKLSTHLLVLPLLTACDLLTHDPHPWFLWPSPPTKDAGVDASVADVHAAPPLQETAPVATPPVTLPAGQGSVAEVLRSPCSVDSQCPTPSTCVVAFCQIPAGLCTTRARNCDDSNPTTLDDCVDKVGCENKPEPSPLKVVDSCGGLPKQIVCGADGINYYNPCSAVNSAQVSYTTAPCRAANTYCSPSTAACLKGTRCIDGLCR